MPGISNGPGEEASSTTSKREPCVWQKPQRNEGDIPQFTLLNTLTKNKDVFVPRRGNKVAWYICGPTVYDSAHMGHARAYLSFDILRRVMQSYFGYDVEYVMNVTDIDDKIIKRSRQRHLLDGYMAQTEVISNVLRVIDDVSSAMARFKGKFETELDPDKKKMMQHMMLNIDTAVSELEKAVSENGAGDTTASSRVERAKDALLFESRDVLADWLDSRRDLEKVIDHEVFMRLARHYENEFHGDMVELGVLSPDVLTRVSEYVPEIIAYIETILQNGFGYVAKDGSVYFDTTAFDGHQSHYYAKLNPHAFGDAAATAAGLREGEGELSLSEERLRDRRSQSDFALWKASKCGEPFWESPWGNGRPGWHIECSVMASAVCGAHLDIHSGGFDLKFPHHDNEIAQSEAYFGHNQWVNYFLHCGTLRIQGMKMSKSLKNFITIREALKMYSARQLRILFLMHFWADTLDYSASTMERAIQFEKMCQEFFLLVKHYLRLHWRQDKDVSYQKFEQEETNLRDQFYDIKEMIHKALCDSVDTSTVMEKIRLLIGASNAYLKMKDGEEKIPNCLLIRNVAIYITWLFRVFGVVPESADIGFASVDDVGGDKEQLLLPYLSALADFRENVRTVAVGCKLQEILKLCDDLRDDILPELGVRLEDKKPGQAKPIVKLVDAEVIKLEVAQKRAMAAAKAQEKERKRQEQLVREAKMRISPDRMFRDDEGRAKWAQWDDKGLPTHKLDGTEVSKGERKKLQKAYELQDKKHQQYLEQQSCKATTSDTAENGNENVE